VSAPRRPSRWLALGLALPTVLLGVGWLAASFRERASRLREEEARLTGIAAAVRGAIDEGLEELRRREDERPFYLYHHYYSPPDVLAISDPVAVSPLAGGSTDRRIVGWFQVDPDGTIRTPWTVDPEDEGPEAMERVRAIAGSEALADLRELVRGREAGALVARVPEREPDVLLAAAEPARPRTTRRQRAAESVTTGLNTYAVELANEIQQAQAGDIGAYTRVAQRGREAPVTVRRSVPVETIRAQQSAPSPSGPSSPAQQASARPPTAEQASAPILEQASARPQQASASLPIPQQPPARRAPPAARDRVEAESPGSRDATSRGAGAPSPPLAPTSIEVDYTPMTWRVEGDTIALSRIVSHEGAAVLQGVILDRRAIAERWAPEVIARIAAGGPSPRVIDRAASEDCALRVAVSATVRDLDLCFDRASLSSRLDDLDSELRYQLGALLGLLLAVAGATWALQRASRRAEELARERSLFVSAVSHELRTPLTTIRMHAEMLEEDLVTEDRRPKVYREIVAESVRLSRLVENVLEISRLEEGRRPLRTARADLRAHVRQVIEQQVPFARAKGFELEAVEGEPVEAGFDAQAVEQIVVNLVDNAVKYAAGTEDPRIEIAVDRDGDRAVVRVRDRGPGIPESERERVFERFHRVERPSSAHKPGTGIGLALVRDLARAHGGDVEARPRDGGGCEIAVSLPAL
jgi:signal transduction histidine kinase